MSDTPNPYRTKVRPQQITVAEQIHRKLACGPGATTDISDLVDWVRTEATEEEIFHLLGEFISFGCATMSLFADEKGGLSAVAIVGNALAILKANDG